MFEGFALFVEYEDGGHRFDKYVEICRHIRLIQAQGLTDREGSQGAEGATGTENAPGEGTQDCEGGQAAHLASGEGGKEGGTLDPCCPCCFGTCEDHAEPSGRLAVPDGQQALEFDVSRKRVYARPLSVFAWSPAIAGLFFLCMDMRCLK
jgi:hypothetical protein